MSPTQSTTTPKPNKRQAWMKITPPPPPSLERLLAELMNSFTPTPLASPPVGILSTTTSGSTSGTTTPTSTSGSPGTVNNPYAFNAVGYGSSSNLSDSTPPTPPATPPPSDGSEVIINNNRSKPYSVRKCPMPSCDAKIVVRLNGVFVYKWINEHFSQRHHEQMHVVVNIADRPQTPQITRHCT